MNVVGVVGLGYVGLPLAIEFGKLQETIGFDTNVAKIESYARGVDPIGETSGEVLRSARHLRFTTDGADLARADFILITVPTPVDSAHQPDFGPLIGASRLVGRHMKKGAVVVYESTVYPGATEEICLPVLEEASGLKWQRDFHIGYSPERINPGDQKHTLTTTVKVVSADNPATLAAITQLYKTVVTAGVHPVSSIKVAEAAKVIENSQRDLNIAFMNELAIIFNRLDIDTLEVLEAAGSKWNFLPFRPGLVGGHCIGVDPYYLTRKAEMLGYHPEVILSGRRINDNMGKFVAEQTIKQMIQSGSHVKGAKVNVLGLSFKEDFPDIRNSRVIELINELRLYGVEIAVHDPAVIPDDARHDCSIELVAWEKLPRADAVVVAVAHRQFLERPLADYAAKLVPGGCFIDVKARFDAAALRQLGFAVWRL